VELDVRREGAVVVVVRVRIAGEVGGVGKAQGDARRALRHPELLRDEALAVEGEAVADEEGLLRDRRELEEVAAQGVEVQPRWRGVLRLALADEDSHQRERAGMHQPRDPLVGIDVRVVERGRVPVRPGPLEQGMRTDEAGHALKGDVVGPLGDHEHGREEAIHGRRTAPGVKDRHARVNVHHVRRRSGREAAEHDQTQGRLYAHV
jgi:hypothetical protein